MASPAARKGFKEHEAFKSRLVHDVLGQDVGDKVPMEKVIMLVWAYRDDPSVVTFMARFVQKYSGSRHVFDGIEFYLPQFAHMIIHLEVDWDDSILERFALVIAQQSVHFALQFNWILQGALEDYHPELEDGAPNPKYNPRFYSRCLRLLHNVERCVVYGKPRAQELQRLYEQGNITREEMIQLELADRRFNALQIANDIRPDMVQGPPLEGTLYVKFPIITSEGKPGPTEFVQRHCVLERHVLNCYVVNGCSAETKLERAMSLEKARISTFGKDKKATTLIVVHTERYEFRLRCPNPEECKLWARRLQEEAAASALFRSRRLSAATPDEEKVETTLDTAEEDAVATVTATSLKRDMTPAQLNRYNFFQNERTFVHNLTQLAEDLRFKDRAERKRLAPLLVAKLDIADSVYMPLCNSSDIWRRIDRCLPNETRVFNTKERCPVIMHFVSRRGEGFKGMKIDPNLDVAEYMHAHLEVTEELESVAEEFEEMAGELEQAAEELRDAAEELKEAAEGDEEHESEDVNGKNEGVEIGESRNVRGADDEMISSTHGSVSNVWQEEEQEKDESRPNNRVQRLLRDSVVAVPSKLAKKLALQPNARRRLSIMDKQTVVQPLAHTRRRVSIMDKQTVVQPLVPILEGNRGAQSDDEIENASAGDGTVVSVEQSSILVKNQMLLGNLHGGDIDIESIEKAKQYVTGGDLWAEKTAHMLEGARKASEADGEDGLVQMEIVSCMAKSNDDLRQEVFVMQMIHYYKSVFAQAKLPIWLKTYRILSSGSSTGLIEVLTDATSLDGLKKSEGYPTEGGLRAYFELVYGPPSSKSFKAAQKNFMTSLAGYAIVSFLLGLKDRHNGNIMIDTRGHIIYIDFGFALGMAPGHEFSMERAPFKLTKEFVEVMDGPYGKCYKEFEDLFVAGFEEARKNFQIALGLVEIMMYKSNYPCFSGRRYGGGKALVGLAKRLMLDVPDTQVKRRARRLVRRSKQHFGTYLYDAFQHATNGYAM